MKRTVSDLMKQRDLSQLPCIEYTATAKEALLYLQSSDVGALLVMNRKTVVGVFSERDFARTVALHGNALETSTAVQHFMSDKVVFVTADYRLDECMAVMVKMKIRHLPVLQGDTPIAFLSMRHIMEALVEENQFIVSQLVTYITGSSLDEENIIRPGLTTEPRTY